MIADVEHRYEVPGQMQQLVEMRCVGRCEVQLNQAWDSLRWENLVLDIRNMEPLGHVHKNLNLSSAAYNVAWL